MGRPKKIPASLATKLHPIVGVKQIMPDTNPLWAVLLKKLQRTARSYGFNRIELPIVDEAKVYEKYATASGLTVDAATLNLNDDVAVSLRSSLLPSLFSAYASFHKADAEPTLHKWLSIGNVMRPIPGGLDSDYQFVFEVLGHFNHLTEAQTIGAVWKFVSDLGLEGLSLEINTIGAEDCQKSYQAILGDFLKQKKFSLCDNCNEDLRIRPFNVLRCTNPDCQEVVSTAPIVLDYLDQNSHKHFTYILEALDELQVPYQLNSLYVGPSGSSHTNVVIKYRHKDQVVIIGEGAYHSEIVSGFGIKNNDAFGFLVSLSALYNCLETQSIEVLQEYQTEVFLVPLGELAAKKSLRLFQDLLAAQVSVYDHFGDVGVKNQLKQAELYKSPIALIMGQKEAMDEMVILRDVKSGMQEIFSYDKIVIEVKKRLGK